MTLYVARRCLQSLFVLVAVAVIAFVMVRFVGDPVNEMVGVETPIAEREALRRELGFDQPLVTQFLRFIKRSAAMDFGASYQLKRPVGELIAERLPATFELALVSLILALAIGVPVAIHAAVRPESWLSRATMSTSLVFVSLPTFMVAILLIYVFAVQLRMLPSFGRGEVVDLGIWSTGLVTASGLRALVLPTLTLALFQAALVIRLVRAEMDVVLRSEHIRFARARGLSWPAVYLRHALRAIVGPVAAIVALQFGSVFAFGIVTEHVFQWPGLGLLFLNAVQSADIPIMAAYLLLVAVLFVTVNLLADLLHVAVDPRIRLDRGDAART